MAAFAADTVFKPGADDPFSAILVSLLTITCRMTRRAIVFLDFSREEIGPAFAFEVVLCFCLAAVFRRGNQVALLINKVGLSVDTADDIRNIFPLISLRQCDIGMLGFFCLPEL